MAPSWGDAARPADFFTLKGVSRGARLAARHDGRRLAEGDAVPAPGAPAVVELGGLEAGWLGEVHPLVCREWDLEAAVGFQIELAELVAGSRWASSATRT